MNALKILKAVGTSLVPGLSGVVGQFVEDPNKAKELTSALNTHVVDAWSVVIQQAGNVIMAEANSESWLARNWRPLTMILLVGMLGAHWFGYSATNITEELVSEFVGLLKIGLGGYIVGRSAEKGLKIWKAGPG